MAGKSLNPWLKQIAQPAAFLLVATLIAIAVGCGEDSDNSSGNSPMSKAEFVKRANAVCEKARSTVKEEVEVFLERQRSDKPTPVLYADLTHLVLLPAVEREMEAIRYLRIPPKEVKPIDAILDVAEPVVDELANTSRIASLEVVKREFAEARKQYSAYGLNSCTPGLGGEGA
jgi:hypothetical protein